MRSLANIPKCDVGSEGLMRRISRFGLKYPFWDLSQEIKEVECCSSRSIDDAEDADAVMMTMAAMRKIHEDVIL